MAGLIETHGFVADCDCLDCAIIARDKLRAFAQDVMECWPMGDVDGGALQDMAEKNGLIVAEVRHEDCSDSNGNGCNCAGCNSPQDWELGVVCYRKQPLLLGHNATELSRATLSQDKTDAA
ncbi:MAG: hypothetical protein M0Q15_16005 [Nevskia sp.]|nr:hypothetical protein [Nevskia sp.]